jgi:exodeoxyribonuclease V alpha subunit
MNTSSAPNVPGEFIDLARLTLFAGMPAGNVGANPRIVEILAELLCAAANGIGARTLASLRITEPEQEEIRKFETFFTIENHLLRLPRYAAQAGEVRAFFEARASRCHFEARARDTDEAVRRALDAILPHEVIKDSSGATVFENTHQRIAIAALWDAPLGVLTGGPGTGKTTAAAALLAVRKRLHPEFSITDALIAAPTGKAACRIADSIAKSARHLAGLTLEESRFLCGLRALTLHKALEWGPEPPERGGPFRRNAARPLEAKLILIDEASMVDLSLMHALVRATPADACIVLLGDSDQLESVEVGGVLAELVQRGCQSAHEPEACTRIATRIGSSPEVVAEQIAAGLPAAKRSLHAALSGTVFGLKYSRRAMHAPWVLELANLVRPGTSHLVDRFKTCLSANGAHLRWHAGQTIETRQAVLYPHWRAWKLASERWCGLSEDCTLEELHQPLQQLADFQLLCSTNLQVERANAEGIAILTDSPQRRNSHGMSALPHGCPIIIQANSHTLGLTNGDVGVAIGSSAGGAAALALFASPGSAPRLIPLPQLPLHRPAFGLTIHKSQGSEWGRIAIELPSKSESALLSKNLLYTAITRSSRGIEILGQDEVLHAVMQGD